MFLYIDPKYKSKDCYIGLSLKHNLKIRLKGQNAKILGLKLKSANITLKVGQNSELKYKHNLKTFKSSFCITKIIVYIIKVIFL